MTSATTVLGDIDPQRLGTTLPHEHLIHCISNHSGKPDNTCVDVELVAEELNRFRAGISIEIADERFSLLEGFSAENAAQVIGAGGLDCKVQWPQNSFANLGGQTVRLRINMERTDNIDPHLYAVYLRMGHHPTHEAGR
tara:strand:- start:1817 stop:2233 length:417 start_codon:yes stop_codon:yes gene_type:complete